MANTLLAAAAAPPVAFLMWRRAADPSLPKLASLCILAAAATKVARFLCATERLVGTTVARSHAAEGPAVAPARHVGGRGCCDFGSSGVLCHGDDVHHGIASLQGPRASLAPTLARKGLDATVALASASARGSPCGERSDS